MLGHTPLLLAMLLAGCFSPTYQEALPCTTPDRNCPPDQICTPGENLCRSDITEAGDFVINDAIAGTQALTFTVIGGGRQVASLDDRFLVTFTDDCSTTPGRCDVFARLFDSNAVPAVNGVSMDTGDFIVNLSDAYTEEPSIAASTTSYFISWQTGSTVTGVALGTDGTRLGPEIDLSGAGVQTSSQVAQRPGDGFVVAWLETATETTIQARLVSPTGEAQINGVTNDAGMFIVADAGANGATNVTVGATRVGAAGSGFVVVWSADNELRARFFSADGSPLTGSYVLLAEYAFGATLGKPNVVWNADHIVVAWTVRHTGTAGLENGALFVQPFLAPTGEPDGAAVTIASNLPPFLVPALAVMSEERIAVGWHNCDDLGDGWGCGVFLQIVTEGGAAGEPALVNTTTRQDQRSPSLVELAPGELLAVWNDASELEPDTSDGAVRGRVVFPGSP